MTWLYAVTDPADQWLGIDKEAHLFGAAFATCAFGWPVALVLGLVVEGIEAWRWMRLGSVRQAAILAGAPWPFLTDRASPKDMIANAVGILLALVLT